MTRTQWLIGAAVAAAIGGTLYMTGYAKAADLGGNCCADLEERVAELEATTARKGNRKVSLTISGVVHKGILYHNNDDLPGSGKMSLYDGSTDPSRIRMEGKAKMSPNVAAGFVIEIAYGNPTARSLNTGAALLSIGAPDGTNEFQVGEVGTVIRHSYVYLTGPVGEVSIGQQSMATDGIIEINLSNSNVAGRALSTMPLNFGGAASGFNFAFDGYRANAVKWKSPTLAGFEASASWTDTDSWDAALRYAGEAGGFRFAAGLGYRNQESQNLFKLINLLDLLTVDWDGKHTAVSGSASVKHMNTGLFANAFYSRLQYDYTLSVGILPPLFSVSVPFGEQTLTGYGGQVGVERNWLGFGATTLFAEWQKVESAGDATIYGLGAVQAFDAMGLDLYASWRHGDVKVDAGALCGICKDMDIFTAGARIKF